MASELTARRVAASLGRPRGFAPDREAAAESAAAAAAVVAVQRRGPQAREGQGQEARAGNVCGLSTDLPLDFMGAAHVAKRSASFLVEAAYAMIAPGGNPPPPWPHPPSLLRTLSVPRQPQVFLRTNTAAPCARGLYL